MWDKANIDFFKKNFNNMSDIDISKNQSKTRRINLKKSTNHIKKIKQFTEHMTKNDLKNIIESSNFYKEGDKVLIEYWYNDMITCVMINEIVGRKYKITHNIPESKIFNAPDELIRSTDIIDIYKERDNSIIS